VPRFLACLALIAIAAAACGGGGSAATPSPSSSQLVGGLTRGLIGFVADKGVGVIDPATGKSTIVAPLPAGGAFRVAGPAWGPAPDLPYPVLYFTVHDDRPAETRDTAGVTPYDWLFRVDPFTGTIEPLAASQDSQSEGPLGLVANDHYLGMTVGCCAAYEVDALDLTQRLGAVKILAKPTDPVTFFTEGVAPGSSGLIAVRQFGTGTWYWLNADAGVLNPFPLKLGPEDGPIAISADGSLAAVSLPSSGVTIEPISVAVPVASPTPTPGVTPNAPPKASSRPTSSASPIAPRPLASHLPHPDSLAWSPDGKQIIVAVSSEFQLYSSSAPDGTPPVSRFLIAGGVTGVSWSGPIPDMTFASIKPSAGPQAAVDALLVATQLPAAADTAANRPFTKVYLWQFDSSKVSPISSIADATPAVLATYPPLEAGVVLHHWAASASWALIGGCTRYRVVVTGSIPPVASTIGLTGSALCSAPKSTPKPSPS
jgi:hypothetical protein